MSLTTNKNDPYLHEVNLITGQNKTYLILSDEERAKGFVRPVRRSYKHVGREQKYKDIHRMLTPEEKKEFSNKNYVAVMTVLENEDGSFKGGIYVTQKELDAFLNDELIGGCGTVTTMAIELAETYAANPKFYGATFCCGCGKYLPVDEFIWEGTNELVGS